MLFYPYYVHVLLSSSSRLSLVEVMKSWLILRSFGHVQHDADGKAYYTFEFIAQAPTFTRHALSTICIGNGMKLIRSKVKIIMCVYVALNLSLGCYISLVNKLQMLASQFFHFVVILCHFYMENNFHPGKFYTLTTGANERRWGKMKDKLQTVIDSFQIVNLWVSAHVLLFHANCTRWCSGS